MKKLPMLLAAALLVVGAGQAASALTHPSTAVVKYAYPDNGNFYQGHSDGDARGAYLGQGNPQVRVEVEEAKQATKDAYDAGDTASGDYWWGYRIGLQHYL